MKYDEFEQRLRDVKEEFLADTGKQLDTVKELEDYLRAKRLKIGSIRKGRPTLKSLRGLGF